MRTILHVGKYYPPVPGGMERVLQLLCEGERRFVDSRVLVAGTHPATQREVRNGVPVTRAARLATVGSVALTPTLAFELRRLRPDLIVLHEPNPVALVADWVSRLASPLIVYFHSEVVRARWKYRLFYRPFLRRVLDRAAHIVVASPHMATHAEQLAGHRQKCTVIPYGLDASALAATPDLQAQSALARRVCGAPLLLFVGRLVPYKGVGVLIEAMRTVDARLVVVGDGPLRPALEEQAQATCPGRVRFVGAVPDAELSALYLACDVLVLPSVSRAEAFGMVQLEAMARGKPVVSTDLPSGVPWVNQHGRTGLVVPPGDSAALASAITALLHDPDWRTALGTAARQRVMQEFTADRMAQRTVALYDDVLR